MYCSKSSSREGVCILAVSQQAAGVLVSVMWLYTRCCRQTVLSVSFVLVCQSYPVIRARKTWSRLGRNMSAFSMFVTSSNMLCRPQLFCMNQVAQAVNLLHGTCVRPDKLRHI
jgi:hypothetical protein